MKLEHLALNVPEPNEMGRWYVSHLGLTVKRKQVEPPYGHFLADDSGTVMIEIYRNPDADMPDYAGLDPFAFHLAFLSNDVTADTKRLADAGASVYREPQDVGGGDEVSMLRDPWGVPIQLVRRGKSMI